jgi:transposase-like protein
VTPSDDRLGQVGLNRPRSRSGPETTGERNRACTEKYPDELRERSIRFACDLVDGPEKLSVNAACRRVGEQLGIQPDTLRNWLKQARVDAGAVAAIGSVGDAYDNAQAESLIGLYKTECTRRDDPGRSVDGPELATLSWVHWFNTTRLHSALEHKPPIEVEQEYCRSITAEQQPLPA